MSISSVGSSNDSAIQFLRQTQSTTRPEGPPREGGREGMESQLTSALQSQGFSDTQLSDLREKIDTAMKSARENGSDPEALKSAVDSVLQEAGVDLEQFQQDIGAPSGPPQGMQGGSSSTSGAQFDSFLQSRGIDPTQFKTALMSSINNGTDLSQAFSGADVGSDVDVFA